MKKISLHLDALRVESFETTSVDPALRGTVKAYATDEGPACLTDGCGDTQGLTCGVSCNFDCSETCPANTCAYSCEGTCGCPTWQGETCGLC